MSYVTAQVANSFLAIVKKTGESLDPMKIQKLVYFSHGWHLGFDEGPLCAEYAQAWRWGPVFPDLYHTVKVWGRGPVREPLRVFSPAAQQWEAPVVPPTDVFATNLIERVWEVYGPLTGLKLSQITHEADGPWDVTRKNHPGQRDVVIPNDLIQEYFAKKIAAHAGT